MKTCLLCRVEKPASDFYAAPKGKLKLSPLCKECHKRRMRENYYNNHAAKCEYERRRFARPDRKAKLAEYQRARRKREPEKNLARQRLSYAVRRGTVLKPKACPHCGSTDRIQAHHHDYTKPLDVAWACFKCHRRLYHAQLCDGDQQAF